MKLIIALAAGASAYVSKTAPARTGVEVQETKADLEAIALAANPTVGFWDPLNIADSSGALGDNAATIAWYRQVEIKHGRVAMAAFVGYVAQANGVHWPWKMPGDELCGPGCNPIELWENLPRL